MRIILGTPVEGPDFFGRENELAYAWNLIENGNNLMLPSPRRVGKTSFALKLTSFAREKGWNVIEMNLEKSATNEIDFVDELVKALQQLSGWEKVKAKGVKLLDLLSRLRPSVAIGGVEATVNWDRQRDDAYQQVAELLPHNEPTLIFFDELTVLLNKVLRSSDKGLQQATNFLHWLRALRLHSGSRIRWIFCSSVGIENFTHQHRISDTINDVHDYFLHSFSQEESKSMLTKLSADNNFTIEEALQEAIVTKLDYCLPFFLQLIFDKMKNMSIMEKTPVDTRLLDRAYEALINERHFNTWVERIPEQYGTRAESAFAALRLICQSKKGIKRPALLNQLVADGLSPEKAEEMTSTLLYMLKNDGYLIEETGFYRFRSPLLRDFWYNRFVK